MKAKEAMREISALFGGYYDLEIQSADLIERIWETVQEWQAS